MIAFRNSGMCSRFRLLSMFKRELVTPKIRLIFVAVHSAKGLGYFIAVDIGFCAVDGNLPDEGSSSGSDEGYHKVVGLDVAGSVASCACDPMVKVMKMIPLTRLPPHRIKNLAVGVAEIDGDGF